MTVSVAQNTIVLLPAWEVLPDDIPDAHGVFPSSTEKEVRASFERLEQISPIFENSHNGWFLSGAINIPLYSGKFERNHHDIDICTFSHEALRFETEYLQHGYSLFRHWQSEQGTFAQKVSMRDAMTMRDYSFFLSQEAAPGVPRIEHNSLRGLIDVQFGHVTEDGTTLMLRNGSSTSIQFSEPTKFVLPSGKILHIAHPFIVAYYKLHLFRTKDIFDLRHLWPHMRQVDILELVRCFSNEEKNEVGKVTAHLEHIWSLIQKMRAEQYLSDASLINEVVTLLESQSEIEKETVQLYTTTLTALFQSPYQNPNDFCTSGLSMLNPGAHARDALNYIKQLEDEHAHQWKETCFP